MAKEKDYSKIRQDYETKKTIRDRQARRRQRLTEAAQKAGFPTIDKLADAILSGQVAIVKNQ